MTTTTETAALQQQVARLVVENQKLRTKVQFERQAKRKAQDKLKAFGGVTPADVAELRARTQERPAKRKRLQTLTPNDSFAAKLARSTP